MAAPRRPQTLGKIERFWGTLWRECVETAVFLDLGDAQRRIGLFIDPYNFQTAPHQGIGGLTRPTASSGRRRKCWQRCRRGWLPTPG